MNLLYKYSYRLGSNVSTSIYNYLDYYIKNKRSVNNIIENVKDENNGSENINDENNGSENIEKSYILINNGKKSNIVNIDEINTDEIKCEDNSIKPIKINNNIDETKMKEFIKYIINEKYNGIGSTGLRFRLKLWYKMFDMRESGNCFCCLKTIVIDDPSWHCGHILAAARGGKKVIKNLRAICVKCNLSMKKQNMYQYMIYNETIGIYNLLNILYELDKDDIILINKYRVMKVKYDNCLSILNYYSENKEMSKYLINWFKRDIKTDNDDHLHNILIYLSSYSKK